MAHGERPHRGGRRITRAAGPLTVVSTVAADGLETALERRAAPTGLSRMIQRRYHSSSAAMRHSGSSNGPRELVGAHELRNEFVVDAGHHALGQDRRPQAA